MANNVHTALYSVQYKVHTIGIVHTTVILTNGIFLDSI